MTARERDEFIRMLDELPDDKLRLAREVIQAIYAGWAYQQQSGQRAQLLEQERAKNSRLIKRIQQMQQK